MDLRSTMQGMQGSSSRSIKPFGDSFSCDAFGGFAADEAEMEAMAAEAEAAAQQRISKAHQRDSIIDGLIEFECDEQSPGAADAGKIATHAHSPPREGAGLAHMKQSRGSKNKKWEPQIKKILDDGCVEEGDGVQGRHSSSDSNSFDLYRRATANGVQGRQSSSGSSSLDFNRRASVDCEPSIGGSSMNSGDFIRKDSVQESFHNGEGARNSHNSVQESLHNSGATSIITSEDKSGIVLASGTNSEHAPGIHINAPNVTINYIIEQKAETKPPVSSLSGIGKAGMRMNALNSDESVSLMNDASVSCPNLNLPSIASSVMARTENSGSTDSSSAIAKEEDAPMQQRNPDIHQKVIPKNQFPKFIAPLSTPPMPVKTEKRRAGNSTEAGHQLHHPSKLDVNMDFNDSFTTMTASVSTNMSKRGGQTASTASMSTNMSKNPPESWSALDKTLKDSTESLSQPYDLSEMLDSLWSPDNSKLDLHARHGSSYTSKSPVRSRAGSDSTDSGVYTAGYTGFYTNTGGGIGGENKGGAQSSKSIGPSLNEFDGSNRLAQHVQKSLKQHIQKSSNSDAGAGIGSRLAPALKQPSSSWGGLVDPSGNEEGRRNPNPYVVGPSNAMSASERDEMAKDEANRRNKDVAPLRSRSISRGKGREDMIGSKASYDERGNSHSKAGATIPLQSKYDGGMMYAQGNPARVKDMARNNTPSGSTSRDRSRSMSQGKGRGDENPIMTSYAERGNKHSEEMAIDQLQSTYDGGRAYVQGDLARVEGRERKHVQIGPAARERSRSQGREGTKSSKASSDKRGNNHSEAGTSRGESGEEDFAAIKDWTFGEGEEYHDHNRSDQWESNYGVEPHVHQPMVEEGDNARGEARDASLAQEREKHYDRAEMRDQRQSKSQGGGAHDDSALPGDQQVTWSDETPEKHPTRDLLASLQAESDRSLSVYEGSSGGSFYDPQLQKRGPGQKMGAIAEHVHDDVTSVTSSVPEYKISSDISEFARNFVNQFSMQDEKKQKQQDEDHRRPSVDYSTMSMKEDGSDRSAIEEVSAGDSPPRNRRSSTCGRMESKVVSKSSIPKRPTQPNKGRSKSLKMNPQSAFSSVDKQALGQGRSQSMKPMPQSAGLLSEEEYLRSVDQSNSSSRARSRSRSRRLSEKSHDSQNSKHMVGDSLRSEDSIGSTGLLSEKEYLRSVDQRNSSSRSRSRSRSQRLSEKPHDSQNSKYMIGDSLQSEDDIIRDYHVENILRLEAFDNAFVRRSGGRWTYSVVSEVNENRMRFVLDRKGSKKKIERDALLHNVRRLNYAECFNSSER